MKINYYIDPLLIKKPQEISSISKYHLSPEEKIKYFGMADVENHVFYKNIIHFLSLQNSSEKNIIFNFPEFLVPEFFFQKMADIILSCTEPILNTQSSLLYQEIIVSSFERGFENKIEIKIDDQYPDYIDARGDTHIFSDYDYRKVLLRKISASIKKKKNAQK